MTAAPGGESRPAAGRGAKPPARSWLWVEADGVGGKRVEPHTVTLALDADDAGGAILDLFAERGGREFSGLTLQSIRVPGITAVAQLSGKEAIDPPPVVVGIGRMGAALPTCGGAGSGASPLRKLGGAPTGDEPPAPIPEEPEDLDEEDAAPDDDPALGDIETYRARRAEEGKLETAIDPDLDEGSLADADAAAAAERALVAGGQAYEVESVRLRFGALLRGAGGQPEIEIDVEGRCAAIDERGEKERAGIPFGGRLVAEVQV